MDLIDRQQAIDAMCDACSDWCDEGVCKKVSAIQKLPSAQPDYKEVLGWLLAYHTISFDLHGRYLPHEVISWLTNDFTREFIAVREQNG